MQWPTWGHKAKWPTLLHDQWDAMQKFQSGERLCMAPSCHIGFWGRQESRANTPLLSLCLCPHYSFLLECCSLVHFYPPSKQATTHSSVLLPYGSQKSSCLPLTFKTACVIQIGLGMYCLVVYFFMDLSYPWKRVKSCRMAIITLLQLLLEILWNKTLLGLLFPLL